MSAAHLPFVCAWCERVRTGAGLWEEADAVGLDAAGATHGICPDCLETEQHAASLAVACR